MAFETIKNMLRKFTAFMQKEMHEWWTDKKEETRLSRERSKTRSKWIRDQIKRKFEEWRERRKQKRVKGPAQVLLHPGAYYTAVFVSVIPLMFSTINLFVGWGIHYDSFTFNVAWISFPISLVYFLAGWNAIQASEYAGISVLEIPGIEVDEGYVYDPLGFTKLIRLPRGLQQEQFPAEPEKISKEPDEVADAMRRTDLVRPIRITTGGPEDQYNGDPLNSRLTLEPTFTIGWQLERNDTGEAGLFQFLVNMPGDSWPTKRAELLKRMRDTGEAALKQTMAKHSAAWSIDNNRELIEAVATELRAKTDQWGIIICEVNVLDVGPSHDINKAIAEIPASKARAQATENTARAERIRLTLEGEGKAAARKAELIAEGEGVMGAAMALGMSGAEYRNGEIAKTALGDKAVILGDSGIASIIGIGKIIQEANK